MSDDDYVDRAVAIIKKNGGCGKTFPKSDGKSMHGCTCGFNKWNYLCPECEARKDAVQEKSE